MTTADLTTAFLACRRAGEDLYAEVRDYAHQSLADSLSVGALSAVPVWVHGLIGKIEAADPAADLLKEVLGAVAEGFWAAAHEGGV